MDNVPRMQTFTKESPLDKWDIETLESLDLDHKSLTRDQIDTILIPFNAPENYMCDGEISKSQAKIGWRNKLVNCGLDVKTITRLCKLVQ